MPAIGEIYQATYQMLLRGQTVENVIHYRGIAAVTTDADAHHDADLFWGIVAPAMTTDTTFTAMVIKKMTPLELEAQIVIPVSAAHGANAGTTLNNQVAVVLTKRTGTAGKSHRGRIYSPGVLGGFTDQNSLIGGGLTTWGTVCTDLIGTLGPSGTATHLQIGLYSRVIGGTHPFTVAGWQPLTRVDLQTVLGAQRRRRLGVGI